MNDNIAFCRAILKVRIMEVQAAFPGIKVSEAGVVKATSGVRPQYLFEFIHDGERFAEYVCADNAYEAREKGWSMFLNEKGVTRD